MKPVTHYEAEDGSVWDTEAEALERDAGLAQGVSFCDDPIHNAFGLTYASYLVIPRSILQAMPVGWQQQAVKLLEQIESLLPYEREMWADGRSYTVSCRKNKAKVDDPYRQYRHSRWTPEDFKGDVL